MPPVRPQKTKNAGLFNLLTALTLALTLLLCGAYAAVFINPRVAINPFPPATETFTPSPAPPTFEPTWTAKPVTATVTASPLPPTFTPLPTGTLFVLGTPLTPNLPPTATQTLRPVNLAYNANVEYFDSVTFKPASSCGDFIVAGRVLDAQNQHKQGYIVQLGGRVPGKSFNPPISTLTGSATDFGPSGFEFVLGVAPVASSQTLWVQLFDQQGAPLSAQIFISSYNDCKKNLILVGFRQ